MHGKWWGHYSSRTFSRHPRVSIPRATQSSRSSLTRMPSSAARPGTLSGTLMGTLLDKMGVAEQTCATRSAQGSAVPRGKVHGGVRSAVSVAV